MASRDSLHRPTATADLLLGDAHWDRFQEAVLELRHDVTEAQAVLRRDNAARRGSRPPSGPNAGPKELCRLASATAAATKHLSPCLSFGSIAEEIEMAAAASIAVFMTTMFMLWPWHPHARRRQHLWPLHRRPRQRRGGIS
uniref:Uncharacterized protein n=1 Tax=Oryza meridionalis TaxID=40149 RepID=A0A0E0EN41_9ORYZ